MAGFLSTALLWYYSYSPWLTAKASQVFVSSLISGYVLYWTFLAVYRLHFHPLAKYPGSSVAAISTEWWATLVNYKAGQKVGASGYLFLQGH